MRNVPSANTPAHLQVLWQAVLLAGQLRNEERVVRPATQADNNTHNTSCTTVTGCSCEANGRRAATPRVPASQLCPLCGARATCVCMHCAVRDMPCPEVPSRRHAPSSTHRSAHAPALHLHCNNGTPACSLGLTSTHVFACVHPVWHVHMCANTQACACAGADVRACVHVHFRVAAHQPAYSPNRSTKACCTSPCSLAVSALPRS